MLFFLYNEKGNKRQNSNSHGHEVHYNHNVHNIHNVDNVHTPGVLILKVVMSIAQCAVQFAVQCSTGSAG